MNAPARSEDEARAILARELLRLAPRRTALGEGGALAVAGWTLLHGMEYEAARIAWARAAEIDPTDVEAAFSEALCLLELSRFEEAAERFRRVIELDDRVAAAGGDALDWMEHDPAYRLGVALHALGRLEEADAAYEESARRNGVGTDSLRELARSRLARRDARRALEALERLERRTVRLTLRAEVMAMRADAEALLRERTRR